MRKPMLSSFAVLAVVTLFNGCASTTAVDADTRLQLAPTGALRVGLNLGNTLLTRRDPAGGDPTGIAVDIARELGRRAGVPVRLVPYDNTGLLGSSIGSGQWDIAFFAIEAARAREVDFSPPYVAIETTYLVRSDAALRSMADVDREDVIVAVQAGAGYESTMLKSLSRAKVLRVRNSDEGLAALKSGKAHAFAGLRPAFVTLVESGASFRVVEGNFMTVDQAIGVQKGRPAAAQYVAQVVRDMKRSGFVARVIADHQVRGLTIP